MLTSKIPTSADIYLQVNGTKVAVVQSYRAVTTRKSRTVEAFGQEEPVATVRGASRYELELSRLYATDDAIRDGINFAALDGFSLVICKPDRRVIFDNCQWSTIEESAEVGGMVLERAVIYASHRVETAA